MFHFTVSIVNAADPSSRILDTPTGLQIRPDDNMVTAINEILETDPIAIIQGGAIYRAHQAPTRTTWCFINRVSSGYKLISGTPMDIEDPKLFGDRYYLSIFTTDDKFTMGCRNENSYTQEGFTLRDLSTVFGKPGIVLIAR